MNMNRGVGGGLIVTILILAAYTGIQSFLTVVDSPLSTNAAAHVSQTFRTNPKPIPFGPRVFHTSSFIIPSPQAGNAQVSPSIWEDRVDLDPVDLSCNPCLDPSCRSEKELDISVILEFCARGKHAQVDPSTWKKSKEKFVLLTMLEPTKSWDNHKTFRGIAAMLESVDRFYPFEADFMVLVDHTSTTEMRLLQAITHRKLVFVNVLSEFSLSNPEKHRQYPQSSCSGDDTYRSMCRFASGPIFWLRVLDPYDFYIRIDEDAQFVSEMPNNLITGLDEIGGSYGYFNEQTSSSQCRIGLNNTIVEFINRENHDEMGRPWIRLGDFKFGKSPVPNNKWDVLDVSQFSKLPRIQAEDVDQGSFGFGRTPTHISYWTYNCNFEVARLSYFRHIHYQKFWSYFNQQGLFFSTRMGDHEVKTTYMELFEDNNKVGCYMDLPFDRWFFSSFANEF